MTTTIYHNPACGTSRNVLALLRHAGIRPRVIEYLKDPPMRGTLLDLLSRSDLKVADVLRRKGTPYAELGLDHPEVTDKTRYAAIDAHPILLNRPLVDDGSRVRLCRPSDIVLDFFPGQPMEDFSKEDGAPFLRDVRIAADDPDFLAALKANGLPQAAPATKCRHYYAFTTLGGHLTGYGGFERTGEDALIRSIVVTGLLRGKKIGRNIVALICARLYHYGARRVWCLPSDAADYFAKIGFSEVPQTDAPQAILETQLAQMRLPESALFSRSIRL